MRFLPPFLKLILTSCFILMTQAVALATHLRAGEITAERINCTLKFKIYITAYVNTGSTVEFGSGGVLDFGDGSDPKILTPMKSTPVPGALNVGVITYSTEYTFPALGVYKIRYYELNRNADILNMIESVFVNFFLETQIEIDPFKGCNNTPKLLTAPIDKACSGSRWQHNPGAYDTDPQRDSLSYKLIAPQHVDDTRNYVVEVVPGYQKPNARSFYNPPLDYNNARQDSPGKPIFVMDSVTGTITWDAPGQPGEYNIAFMITEWRRLPGSNTRVEIGYVIRDMQILVEPCNPKDLPPEVFGPEELCVVAGEVVSEQFDGSDPENRQVEIQIISQILFLNSSPATYVTTPIGNDARATLTWQTNCTHIQQQPYLVVVKVTDTPRRLATFHTLRITVVGPPPEWNSIAPAPNRSAQLNWMPYNCASMADSIHIWRRIDSTAYPIDCKVTGMPPGLGYEKIKTVHKSQLSYLDTNLGKGLPAGATVCYRLVASFPGSFGNPAGGTESLVSEEVCLKFAIEAPVITRVSVDTTSRTKGQISIQWTPPFGAVGFTKPYTYKVYRAVGFTGESDITLVKTVKWPSGVITVPNTVNLIDLVDSVLNTADNVYNYRVIAFDANNTLIDTSAVASSVRLLAKSLLEKIELNWTANVPWSLQNPNSPLHYIYRGGEDETEGEFVLIDSVYAVQGMLGYTDAGTFNGESLEVNRTYCYRVETHGGYGYDDESKIPDPLINFSQVVCARPSDLKPPCKPDLAIDILDCDEYYSLYGCRHSDFNNVLHWPRPSDDACRDDISHYRIYYSPKANADTTEYILLKDLADHPLDTMYTDRNLASFARCYRLKAVDRSGNESAFSEEVCNDNCPNYQLPNVFTPGNGDDCNDLFSAYSDRNIINGQQLCGDVMVSSEKLADIRRLCPRFVLRVDVVIVDRWGKTVYTYSSGGENSIFIDWDGRDNHGRELNTGTYFYSARVTFEALRPADREKVIKGWVQLVRQNE